MGKQKSWLDRFTSAARWRLGAKEAEEVIADYREMVGNPPRPEEELVRELGKPLDAVKPLTERKTYWVWLAVFGFLVLCLSVPGLSAPWGTWKAPFYWLFGEIHRLARVPAFLGVVGALVWFRRTGRKEVQLPKAVPVLLAVLLVWLVMVLGADWAWMHDSSSFSAMWGEMVVYRIGDMQLPSGHMVSRSFFVLNHALTWGGGLGMTAVGVFALVKARTEDRRWCAVYVLAMTAVMVSLETLALMTNMTITGEPTWENFFFPYFCTDAALTAVGLLGTGVALC